MAVDELAVEELPVRVEAPPAPVSPRPRLAALLPHLAMLVTIVLWSGNGVVIKVGLAHVRPVPFTAARFVIASAVLVGYSLVMRESLLRRPPLKLVLAAAVTGVVMNQLSFTYGLQLTTAVDVSIIMGLGPLLTALGLIVVVRKRPPARRLIGIGIGFAGVIAVVAASSRGGGGTLIGDLIAVGAPLAWAAYTLIASEAGRKTPASLFLTWMVLIALVAFLPPAAVEAIHGSDQWLPALPSLLYSGVLATACGYLFMFWAIPRLGVTETAVYTYLQPLLGAVMAAVILGEKLGPLQAAGAAAIMAGAYLGSWSRVGAARGGRGG